MYPLEIPPETRLVIFFEKHNVTIGVLKISFGCKGCSHLKNMSAASASDAVAGPTADDPSLGLKQFQYGFFGKNTQRCCFLHAYTAFFKICVIYCRNRHFSRVRMGCLWDTLCTVFSLDTYIYIYAVFQFVADVWGFKSKWMFGSGSSWSQTFREIVMHAQRQWPLLGKPLRC